MIHLDGERVAEAYQDGSGYLLVLSDARGPYSAAQHADIEALVAAMRQVGPDLRRWRPRRPRVIADLHHRSGNITPRYDALIVLRNPTPERLAALKAIFPPEEADAHRAYRRAQSAAWRQRWTPEQRSSWRARWRAAWHRRHPRGDTA